MEIGPILAAEIDTRFGLIREISQKFAAAYPKAQACGCHWREYSVHCGRLGFAHPLQSIRPFQPLRQALHRIARQLRMPFGRLSRPQNSLSDGQLDLPSDAKAGGASSPTRKGLGCEGGDV